MNDRDLRRYERAGRVKTFGQQNAADFAAGSKALELFTNVGGLILRLDKAKADQAPDRVSKETLLDALSLDLKNIARTARHIELEQNGFAAPYRLPDNTAENALTTHADAVLETLEEQDTDSAAVKTAKTALRARFVAYEMPADFVADLRADRDVIAKANKLNDSEVQEGAGNTALIGTLLGLVNDEITGLDAIMFNKYSRQPDKLRAWQSASRVERAPQREKKSTTPPTPAPA